MLAFQLPFDQSEKSEYVLSTKDKDQVRLLSYEKAKMLENKLLRPSHANDMTQLLGFCP
jgi:hypothetical protein